MQAWAATHHIDRGLLVKEWQAGKRVAAIQRTDSGTTAGGGIPTDRNPDYIHTLDTLDEEIAAATLPMDFDIYNIPVGSIAGRKKLFPAKRALERVVRYSQNAWYFRLFPRSNFCVIRSAHPSYKSPGRLSGYINAT
jgi:exodeoxyribonuclease VIII